MKTINTATHLQAFRTILKMAFFETVTAATPLDTIRLTYNFNLGDAMPIAFHFAEEAPAQLLATKHKLASGKFYTLQQRHKAVGFTIDPDSHNVKFSEVKPHGFIKLYDYRTEKAELISQSTTSLTISETREAIKRRVIAGNIELLTDKLERYKRIEALNDHAQQFKRDPDAVKFAQIALDLCLSYGVIAYNAPKRILYSEQGSHADLFLNSMLKTVNFNAHKHADFLTRLDEALTATLKQNYILKVAETPADAWTIYGYNSRGLQSCMNLGYNSERNDTQKANIRAALECLMLEPAPGVERSFNVCGLINAQTGETVARWIERARNGKVGHYARVYHTFNNDSQASRVLEMFDRKRIEKDCYFGAIIKLEYNENDVPFFLYCDDIQSRNNIRIKTTSTGVEVLQYGGSKGEKIGEADNVDGLLNSRGYYSSDYEEDDEDSRTCDECGERGDYENFYYFNDTCYCSDCYSENVTTCEDCNDEIASEDSYTVYAIQRGDNEPDYRCLCESCNGDYFTPPHANPDRIAYHTRYIEVNMN